jgi:hypothetical protein
VTARVQAVGLVAAYWKRVGPREHAIVDALTDALVAAEARGYARGVAAAAVFADLCAEGDLNRKEAAEAIRALVPAEGSAYSNAMKCSTAELDVPILPSI